MNMLLHGVEQPDIRYRDSLSEGARRARTETYIADPGQPAVRRVSLDYESTAKDLQRVVKTKKTELLFLALFLRLLKPGGRAAVIVPDGVLFGSSQGAQGTAPDPGRGPEARRRRQAALRGVQAVRRGLHRDPALHQDQLRRHRPRLVLRRAGRRLLPRRQAHPALPEDKLGASADGPLTEEEHAKNNLPDVLARWAERDGARARAGPHRAELLRPQGRHRRPGLRPVAQPLQGDRPRRGRAPAAAGDHRRPRAAGGGDRRGAGGVEGDAVVSGYPTTALGELCDITSVGRRREVSHPFGTVTYLGCRFPT